MNNTLLIIIVIAIPVIEIIALYLFQKFLNQYKSISKTETSRIGFLKEGFHEIKGKINSLNDKLQSPLSEKPCVYYKFKVKERRGSGRGARWVTIIDDEKYKRFEINDSSGYAIIDLRDSDLNIKIDKKTDSGFLNKATPQMIKALRKYGKSKEGWVFEKSLKYKETYLEEGDDLYVLGEVNDFENYKPVFKKKDKSLIISDKSEEELISELKLTLIFTLAILIVLPLAEFYLITNYLL